MSLLVCIAIGCGGSVSNTRTLSPPPPVAPLAATVIAPAVVLCVAVVVRTAQCLALGRWGAVAGARSVYTVVSPVYTVVR